VRTADGGLGAGLDVVPGPLKRIADEARKAPGKPFVLVIDEINRANIAKVFGELYFLLEYRNRDVELLYSDGKERFSLPENLFLIGTMNTADRSIALLDAAMRRRFVFLSMDTGEPALNGVLRRWCQANGHPIAVADLLDRINARMVERGLDPSLTFGPSYFMRADVRDPATLGRLWRRELLPMLREHHYDNQDQLAAWYPFERWLTELGLTSPPVDPESGSADGIDADAPETDHA
jgi:5-methylcytosine-specific restriction protein B